MKKITVNASINYEILISKGILSSAGSLISNIVNPCKALIITDSNVGKIYAQTVKASLESSGFNTFIYEFKAGEESKNVNTLSSIWNELAGLLFTRSDIIVALGGGVVGDVSGFAAATFLRGIRYIQIPTSLLAMTDSSVGGKTAIDLSYGKNLVGSFYQPSLVICDPLTLDTLSEHFYSDGMAEVIKYGMINRKELFEILNGNFDIEDVIELCADDKRQIVEADERDKSMRQLLNFGHTFGHAIEKLSDFKISHGFAVANGMLLITRAAIQMGICSKDIINVLSETLAKFGLGSEYGFSAADIANAALSDKKCNQSRINLVLPYGLGDCRLYQTDVTELEKIAELGINRTES